MSVPVQTGAPPHSLTASQPARPGSALAAGAAAIAFGFGPVIVRGMSLASWSVAAWRLWIGTVILLAYALAARRRLLGAAMRTTGLAGGLFGLHLVASFASFQETSIANATLIGAVHPGLVMLAAPRMFGERRTHRTMFATTSAFGGIALVVVSAGGHDGASLGGDLWAVASVLTFVGYFLRVKRLRIDGLDTMVLMCGVMVWASAVALPLCLVAGGGIEGVGARDGVLMLVLVLGPGIVGQALLAWAHPLLPAAVSATFMVGSPIVSMAASWVAFGDGPRPLQLVGSLVVVASLCWMTVTTMSGRPSRRMGRAVPS
jgi:drug/metabolite transporter (DMT)-like permease